MTAWRILAAAVLIGAGVALRGPLEAHPVTHMLVQMPGLALAGALLASPAIGSGEWNRGGVAALLAAVFTATFWMLPRSIDAAVSGPLVDAAKFATLPLLAGLPLAAGWRRAHPLLRGFLKAQALSMLGILAFLYTHAPVRICNAYLAEDQFRLGIGFLAVAVALAVLWTVPLLVGEAPRPAAGMPTGSG
ncbi:hypothetical protein [Devosia sp.]|uniref:hypothetical protein n=1 Tax=Devosia sp. TaxID=1871048 RepID=UPI002F1C58B8